MGDPARKPPRQVLRTDPPWCAEAQADGVPCYERGRDCETCERARREDPARVPQADGDAGPA